MGASAPLFLQQQLPGAKSEKSNFLFACSARSAHFFLHFSAFWKMAAGLFLRLALVAKKRELIEIVVVLSLCVSCRAEWRGGSWRWWFTSFPPPKGTNDDGGRTQETTSQKFLSSFSANRGQGSRYNTRSESERPVRIWQMSTANCSSPETSFRSLGVRGSEKRPTGGPSSPIFPRQDTRACQFSLVGARSLRMLCNKRSC